MSVEVNKAIVRRMIEGYIQHNLDRFDEFMAPEYVDHTDQVGPEGVNQLFKLVFEGFP